jgi:hypothetical protein
MQQEISVLDFSGVFEKTRSLGETMEDQSVEDLRGLAREFTTTIIGLIEDCADADVTFVPDDPQANDSDEGKGWTLGHIVAHITAGDEETAFLAAEMARGVEYHGRSRYEVPWETITTIAQLRHRLAESLRMRLATLDTWPDEPHLDVTRDLPFLSEHVNAKGHFGLGLFHGSMHLDQIDEVVRQAKAAR